MLEIASPGEEDVLRCGERLRKASRVLVLTGAGISAESGVPTFRGPGGLWRDFRPEDLATPEAFARDPRLVWEWYAWRRGVIAPLRPNRAHEALVVLESRVERLLLVTQNVDGLHSMAGSRKMVELHGNVWRVRCAGGCGQVAEDRRVPLPELPPRCACGAPLRPDVVWFGEALPSDALARAFAAAREAEVVLVVGTSSLVYPAAALPDVARGQGAFVVEVNPDVTPFTPYAAAALRGAASRVVPALIEAAA
jgi:NAD-dependent protein deacetylase/lipoamidase